ncbi:LysR family transcriptional regulator [Salipiger marinus]|uniref:LysR family transcriptional regulator n=1 Tax=Salipiger marinus TaxID=555512 RepID=UPI0040582CD4
MFDLADLRFLVSLASAPSLAGAARGLNVSPPAVSQRLAQIEARLHLRLVDRGRGPLRLTAEGAHLVARAREILAEIETLSDEMTSRAGRIEGPLNVIAPFGYGRLHVAPVLMRFAAEHPALRCDLRLSEDPLGAMRTGLWDVLVHVGRLPDLGITQRVLAPNRRFLVAAPGYLDRHGRPEQPEEIAAHRVGVIREDRADASLWRLTRSDGRETRLRLRPDFACNDGEVLRIWALEGHGVIERSEWSVAPDLAAGRLIRLLPDWSLPDADVVALLNPRAVRATRIDAFLDRLARDCGPGA